MKEAYIKTYKFLKSYITTKGKTVFSELSIEEYNELAKEYKLLNTHSIAYITGLNWRDYKNKLLKEVRR